MKTEHPITPPPELVKQWARYQGFESPEVLWHQIATQAARWGADQELEACCEWLRHGLPYESHADYLRDARRPKPPSLKEQALCHLESFAGSMETLGMDSDLIRRALESLPD